MFRLIGPLHGVVIWSLMFVLLSPNWAIAAASQSPTASQQNVVDPAECDIEPRTVEEFLALRATPIPGAPAGTYQPPDKLPTGTEGDATTIADVTHIARMLVACMNAGDFLRFYALFTDDYIRELDPVPSDTFLDIDAPATPLPDTDRASFLGMWQIQVLDDGRVGGAVAIGGLDDPHPNDWRTYYLILVEHDGDWRIDEEIDRLQSGFVADVVGTPPAFASPQPSEG